MQHQELHKSKIQDTKAFKFLESQNTGVLATVSSKQKPNTAVIYYVIDENFDIYFVTKTSTRKYKDLRENSYVSLCVYDEAQRISVQIDGKANEVEDEEDQFKIVDKLGSIRKKGGEAWFPPVAMLDGGTLAIIRIRTDSLRLSDFKTFNRTEGSDIVEHFKLVD